MLNDIFNVFYGLYGEDFDEADVWAAYSDALEAMAG